MSLEIKVFNVHAYLYYIDTRYDSVTKSLLMMELALLTRCLSTTLNHGTNGSPLENFKLGDMTMPPSLLVDLSCFPACHQVEVLTDKMMIVAHLILTVVHQCNLDFKINDFVN